MNLIKRSILVGLGTICIGLGILGAFLPVLPSTIFFIIAFALLTRASPRMANWLLAHPRFGYHLRAWQQDRIIPIKAKWLASIMMSFSVLILLLTGVPIIWVGLVVVCLLLVAGYIWHCPHAKRTVQRPLDEPR